MGSTRCSSPKSGSLVLCNVTMATKPGGGKSPCPFSDLPLGWDSMGPSPGLCTALDLGCGLGPDPNPRTLSVEGRAISDVVQGPFCGSKQAARWPGMWHASRVSVSVRVLTGPQELSLRAGGQCAPFLDSTELILNLTSVRL